MTDHTQIPGAFSARLNRTKKNLLDRIYARLSGFSHPVTAFISQPEPRTIGSYARGQQLRAGNFMFAGRLVVDNVNSIWEIERPDGAFEAYLHGFSWLDDLAAVGDVATRRITQDWLIGWIDRYDSGHGSGWTPELTGRRLIRWINHALFLLKNQDKPTSDRYFRSLARQTKFLSRRWHSAPVGLPRFEALTGLIYAGLALEGSDHLVVPAMKAIAQECDRCIDEAGGIPSRNPEELMEVFTLLNWAASSLSEAGHMPLRPHLLAIERVAPTLRALRHADGTLARFHGGGIGMEGRLDQALAASGVRARTGTGLAMGFARMSGGRTSVIVDAYPPPSAAHSFNAHASTLAFEMTSGRRPIIVNCGSGAQYGEEWRRAGRATPSHSTLCIDGYSSSRFAAPGLVGDIFYEMLIDTPRDVPVQQSSGTEGSRFQASHDGYIATHGLSHVRQIDMSINGREIIGTDTLGALSENDRIAFEAMMNSNQGRGVAFDIRFHIHPDVSAELDLGGTAVSLSLKSGEVWVFRHDSEAVLALDPGVYLESGRLKPRATKQIVLSDVVMDYASVISWSLARAQDGQRHFRDLEDTFATDNS